MGKAQSVLFGLVQGLIIPCGGFQYIKLTFLRKHTSFEAIVIFPNLGALKLNFPEAYLIWNHPHSANLGASKLTYMFVQDFWKMCWTVVLGILLHDGAKGLQYLGVSLGLVLPLAIHGKEYFTTSSWSRDFMFCMVISMITRTHIAGGAWVMEQIRLKAEVLLTWRQIDDLEVARTFVEEWVKFVVLAAVCALMAALPLILTS